jgi:hypothetical protein
VIRLELVFVMEELCWAAIYLEGVADQKFFLEAPE